jgi:hypothetical protein
MLSLYDPSAFDLTFLVPKHHPFPENGTVKYEYLSFTKRHTKIWTAPYDLFHSVYHPSPFLPANLWFKGKLIVTLHDLNFLYEKSDSKQKKYLRKYQKGTSRVDQLVCISNYAMNDAGKC